LEEGNFPGTNTALDPDELEEERRLMYVAITRAEDTLIMSNANARTVWGKTQFMRPSRFIGEIPSDLVRQYDFSTTNPLASGTRKKAPVATDIVTGDRVVSRLFGAGVVLELWSDVAIIKFDKQIYGTRKVDIRLLEKEL
jgi:DNA helicase II / ATP-dependent DNA helicase PcrA